ncbi:MAG TPA: TetR/AcrR family transcriptional regulator [Polyangiaceae bacterium]|jgi:AcrR family transcriptional regulator
MAKKAVAPAPQPRVRRTQRERSAAMRSRLLEATIDCLYEVGYSRTTTIEVAARAGVSRGAQLHHFPTKKRLVTVAVRHLLNKRLEEFRDAFATLPQGVDKYSAVIDILWEKTSNRAFYAWLELVVAARTDPSLRKTVVEIADQFSEQVQQTFREFFSSNRQHTSPIDIAPVFTFAVMQGLALDHIVWPDGDRRHSMVLQALKALASMSIRALESPRSSPPPAPPPNPEPTPNVGSG